jgi:hypothetical protein
MITFVFRTAEVSMEFPSARLLLRIDGAFEAALGLLLIASLATGLSSTLDLPAPAGRPVVAIVGILLVPLLPVLWRASRTPHRPFVLSLAAANGLGAAIFTGWVLIRHGAFHPAGATLAIALAAVLAVLAVLQARAAAAMA